MPVFQMLATYGTFTLVMGGRLTRMIVLSTHLSFTEPLSSIYRIPIHVCLHATSQPYEHVLLLRFTTH